MARITSLSLDAADPKAIIKPIPVVYQRLDWTELQARFQVDLEKPTDLKNGDVERILKRVFDSYADSVRKSVCLVGKQLLDGEKSLPASSDSRAVEISFLTPFSTTAEDATFGELATDTLNTRSGRLAFRADVAARAYVCAKPTVDFAIKVRATK